MSPVQTQSSCAPAGAVCFACPPAHPVTASARCPARFRTWVHGTASDVGSTGARLRPLADAGLEPGDTLLLTVTVPFVGSEQVRARVEHTGPAGTDVSWLDPPPAFLGALAEYLLLVHPGMTPARLRAAGLPVRDADRAVRYDVGRPEDLPEILDLRMRAHRQDGRLLDLSAADLASRFDADACHLVCRHDGRIVGCVRLLFVDGDPARSQYISWGGHHVPARLWREGFVEAGAGAVDPEFQRAGLFLPLLQHAVRVTAATGQRHLLGACEDHLLRMYQEMGHELLESRDVEPRPGWRFRSHLFALDVAALLAGRLTGRFVTEMAAAARSSLQEGEHVLHRAPQRADHRGVAVGVGVAEA